MEAIKILHVTTVLISISGFIVRGIWMMQQSAKLKLKWVRIVPHVNDTLLLVSAITLVVGHQYPISSGWLVAKIIALLLYIFLGFVTFRLGKTQGIRTLAFISAVLVFAYIVLVAINKSPFLFG